MIKKITVFRKSDVGILKGILDGTLLSIYTNPDIFDALSAAVDVDLS